MKTKRDDGGQPPESRYRVASDVLVSPSLHYAITPAILSSDSVLGWFSQSSKHEGHEGRKDMKGSEVIEVFA